MTCERIDILFVVDNSISMLPIQQTMVEAFDSFAAAISSRLGHSDLHVMVTDSDAAGFEGGPCEGACPMSSGRCRGYTCGLLAERDECDARLGAGSVMPIGDGAANRRCAFI